MKRKYKATSLDQLVSDAERKRNQAIARQKAEEIGAYVPPSALPEMPPNYTVPNDIPTSSDFLNENFGKDISSKINKDGSQAIHIKKVLAESFEDLAVHRSTVSPRRRNGGRRKSNYHSTMQTIRAMDKGESNYDPEFHDLMPKGHNPANYKPPAYDPEPWNTSEVFFKRYCGGQFLNLIDCKPEVMEPCEYIVAAEGRLDLVELNDDPRTQFIIPIDCDLYDRRIWRMLSCRESEKWYRKKREELTDHQSSCNLRELVWILSSYIGTVNLQGRVLGRIAWDCDHDADPDKTLNMLTLSVANEDVETFKSRLPSLLAKIANIGN